MIEQMSKQGMRTIRLRPFNHTGPGQNDQFAAPAFAAQDRKNRGVASRNRSFMWERSAVRRDFLDVRDVVDGYVRAVLRFDHLPPGSALNFASGEPSRSETFSICYWPCQPERSKFARIRAAFAAATCLLSLVTRASRGAYSIGRRERQ